MSRKPGFTLIELLVVIAVIVAIAGILFPAFAQTRASSRQTVCISNMRQIGLAMQLYEQDHDEVLLPVWTRDAWSAGSATVSAMDLQIERVPWTELLQPYLKNDKVFFCPSFDERVLEENAAQPSCDGPEVRSLFPAQHYFAHYGLAWGYSGGRCTAESPRSRDAGNVYPSDPWVTFPQVARPGETAVLQDNFIALTATGELKSAFGCEGGFRGAGQSRHHQGCNYLFLDGHAKLLTLDPRHEPTIACPGAAIPGTGQVVRNCVCARYTTFDY